MGLIRFLCVVGSPNRDTEKSGYYASGSMMGVYCVSLGSGCVPESWTTASSPTLRQVSCKVGSSHLYSPIYFSIMCWMNGSSAKYSPG
jgi:hypothetical protein